MIRINSDLIIFFFSEKITKNIREVFFTKIRSSHKRVSNLNLLSTLIKNNFYLIWNLSSVNSQTPSSEPKSKIKFCKNYFSTDWWFRFPSSAQKLIQHTITLRYQNLLIKCNYLMYYYSMQQENWTFSKTTKQRLFCVTSQAVYY